RQTRHAHSFPTRRSSDLPKTRKYTTSRSDSKVGGWLRPRYPSQAGSRAPPVVAAAKPRAESVGGVGASEPRLKRRAPSRTPGQADRKSTRLNSSHVKISY